MIDESRAGRPTPREVAAGAAIRISTGAVLPRGATAVVPVERAGAVDGSSGRVRVEASAEGDNIRRAGEDVRAGDVVLRRGAIVGPAELGVAASIGRDVLSCARRPTVAVLVTGDELTEPGNDLAHGGSDRQADRFSRPSGHWRSGGWSAAPGNPGSRRSLRTTR